MVVIIRIMLGWLCIYGRLVVSNVYSLAVSDSFETKVVYAHCAILILRLVHLWI